MPLHADCLLHGRSSTTPVPVLEDHRVLIRQGVGCRKAFTDGAEPLRRVWRVVVKLNLQIPNPSYPAALDEMLDEIVLGALGVYLEQIDRADALAREPGACL